MQPSGTILAYFVEGHPRNISVKLLKIVYWPRSRYHLKFFFSIFSSGSNLVYQNGTILSILVGGHLGNISEKFESHWSKGLGGDSI